MRLIHYIVLSIFLCACSSKFSEEETFLANKVATLDLEGYNYVLIIPGAGCNGCIQESEFFLKQNVDNEDLLFILTEPSSLKILRHKTGIKISDKKNIIVDKEGKFKVPTKNAIYPCVIYIDNNEINDIDFQTPQTSALHSLYDKINN